ncbi:MULTISPECIES: DUF4279 domain-containing protein [unclassified Streptomyces]|uniref:DUF4279 domain-containing protein n=1 Tax=unclassified Streptomyces TaxID=2593676 RepID=UPI000CD5C468|nr:DUF4279 domain-containing protein [Streptomyces sp. SM10]
MKNKRSAILLVESKDLSVEEISDIIGQHPDRFRRKGDTGLPPARPLKVNVWEVREDVAREEYLGLALERLWPRILPLERGLAELAQRGSFIQLSLVQWISEADPHQPGFGLGAQELRFLAGINAQMDVDQYAP